MTLRRGKQTVATNKNRREKSTQNPFFTAISFIRRRLFFIFAAFQHYYYCYYYYYYNQELFGWLTDIPDSNLEWWADVANNNAVANTTASPPSMSLSQTLPHMFFPFLFLPCYSCSFTYVYAILLLKVVSGAFYFQRKRNFYLFSCFFQNSFILLLFLHVFPSFSTHSTDDTHVHFFSLSKNVNKPQPKVC